MQYTNLEFKNAFSRVCLRWEFNDNNYYKYSYNVFTGYINESPKILHDIKQNFISELHIELLENDNKPNDRFMELFEREFRILRAYVKRIKRRGYYMDYY